jgi:hypothetical protein
MTSATEKFEKSDFWIFSFFLKSGPVHTPTTAGGGGGGPVGVCLPSIWNPLDFCCLEMRPDIIFRAFLPQR